MDEQNDFRTMIEAQLDLMAALKITPLLLQGQARDQAKLAAVLGLVGELGEISQIANTMTRPWARRDADTERKLMLKELVDMQMYVNELLLIYFIGSHDFTKEYVAKVQKVIERINSGKREERDPDEIV